MADDPLRGIRPRDAITASASGVLALGGAALLPLLMTAEPEAGVSPVTPADPAWWVVVALALGQAVALLWARRLPPPILGVVALGPVLHALIIPGATYSLTTIAVSFAVFWAVLGLRTRTLIPTLIATALVVAFALALDDTRSGLATGLPGLLTAGLQAVAVIAIPLVVGIVARARRDAREAREAELLALKRERDALVRAAVARERVAMSRELHDIAAHHVSGIALLASAITRQIDVDPDAAKLAAQRVRHQSTVVLDDLRRVIGLLREGPDGARTVETLATLGEAVELHRTAGVDVAYEVHTSGRELGAGIGPLAQLVAHRTVQEALANASAHAPGARIRVEVDDRDDAELTATVANGPGTAPDPGPGTRLGLVGMRERADLVDGRLRYGPTADGGWEVRLELPRDATTGTTDDTPAEAADPPGDPT